MAVFKSNGVGVKRARVVEKTDRACVWTPDMGGVHLSPLLFGFVFIHKRFQKPPTPTTLLSPRTLLTDPFTDPCDPTHSRHPCPRGLYPLGIALHKTDSDTPLHTTLTYFTAYDTHVRLWHE